MLFYILFGFFVLFALSCPTIYVSKTLSRHQKLTKAGFKNSLKDSWAALSIGWIISAFIILILLMFFTDIKGNKQVTVSKATFTVAPSSDIDTEGLFSFVSVDENGRLTSHDFDYDYLQLKGDDQDTITLQTDEQYHTWLVPWNVSHRTYIIVE